MKPFLLLLCCFFFLTASSQDSLFIKVHFLYGSKPRARYKDTEPKWFGGVLGGHVGVEGDSGRILNFVPKGKFHWFAKKDSAHSCYTQYSENSFYAILGGNPDSVKKLVVYVPVTLQQKKTLDSLSVVYLQHSPYDYALFGMRCGAAAYEILGQLGIVQHYSYRKTWRKIFYPKKLRKRLLASAAKNGWRMQRQEGSSRRKWEKD